MQKADEGTAAELLANIRKERDALVKEGKIKKGKPLSPVSEEEKPFEIPASWEWVRLGNLCDIVTGSLDANAQSVTGPYPFFTCGVDVLKTKEYAFDCEAILLGGNNAQADYKMHYFTGKFNAYQRVYVITSRCYVYLPYIYYVIQKHLSYLKTISKGTLTKYLVIGQLLNLLIPFPPLAEQQRIVERVEELMGICDRL